MAFELPDDVRKETKVELTLTAKKKILGLNAARIYDIDIEAKKAALRSSQRVAAE
jgi:uncharacterized protein